MGTVTQIDLQKEPQVGFNPSLKLFFRHVTNIDFVFRIRRMLVDILLLAVFIEAYDEKKNLVNNKVVNLL